MRTSAVVGAGLVALLALVTLVGWHTGTRELTALVPGYETMRPPTARALLLLAAAVVMLKNRTVTLILGSLVMLIALATFAGLTLGNAVGVDVVITAVMTSLSAGTVATPMAPASALCLLLLGAAVVASRRARPRLMLALATASLCVSQVAFHGYVYGVSSLYAIGGMTSMAPMTSVSLGVLAVCLHLSRPADGLLGLLRDRGRAGALLRPAILFCMLGPFGLGLLSVAGQRQGWFDAPFGAGIVVMSFTILGCGVSWIAASRLRDVDRERDAAALELEKFSRTLESTVTERTHELAESAASLAALIRLAPVAIVQLDADGGVVSANEQWCELSGLDAPDCLGDGWSRVVHPDDLERWKTGWLQSVETGTSFTITHRLRLPTGQVKWVQASTTPIREAGPASPVASAVASAGSDEVGDRIRGHLASITDVTALRAAEEAEAAARARFETAFSSSPLGTAIVNNDGVVVEANRRLLDLLGYTDPIIGQLMESVFLAEEPSDATPARAPFGDLLRGAGHQELPDRRMRRADATQIWVRVSVAAIEDGNRNAGLLYQLEDITSRRAAEARVEHLALHDPLTNLPNRLLLLDRLTQELNHAQRGGYGVGVLFLDLDRFKIINDSHGHHAGDAVLCAIAERLVGNARTSDTVARLGGDEFVVVCPNVNADSDLFVISNKFRAAVTAPIPLGSSTVSVGVSIGVAHGLGAEDPEALLRVADEDMYRIKQTDGALPG